MAPSLVMKIAVDQIHPHRAPHETIGWQVLAGSGRTCWTGESEHGRVLVRQHVCRQMNFHRASAPRADEEAPARGRPGCEAEEAIGIERRDETVGHHPRADAFDEDM